MFKVNDDLSIYVTRGDIVDIFVLAEDNGNVYRFKPDDILRITVFEKKNCESIVLEKDFCITAEADKIEVYLTEEDTKMGTLINKPKEYWYEVVLNPDTNPQTIIGYDDEGPKIFKIFPEAGN